MKIKRITLIVPLFVLLYVPFVAMASSHGHAGHHGTTGAAAEVYQGIGTIESVNVAGSTVRVDHEPIEALRWPRMVMDLKTKGADMLKGLEQGDRVVFDLMRTDKGYLITRIEKKH
jgi:Cu/Ag efflux protein CusF